MNSPEYEALDSQGLPYLRLARVVDELPREFRLDALIEATSAIAAKIGIDALGVVKFGTPVFCAFGINRPTAKQHKDSKLLLTLGCDVSLDYCASYN